MDFRGITAYPITPLGPGGVLDLDGLFAHVAEICEAGPDGVVVLGTSGSFAYLSREERRLVIETATAAAQGTGVPVGAGISAMTTAEIRQLAWDAENAGVDGYVLNALSYVPLTSAEVADQIETVVQGISLPLCIYNNPTTTGFDFPISLAADVAALEPVVAFKDTAVNAKEFARRRAVLAETCTSPVSHGLSSARLMLESLAPADAWHSGLISFFPREFRLLWEATREGSAERTEQVRRIQHALVGVNRVLSRLRPVSGLHALARIMGVATAPPRRPLAPVDARGIENLREAVSALRQPPGT